MRASHLGLVRWDRPNGLIQIEVRPLGKAQFPRTHKNVRQQPECCEGVRMAVECFNGPQKLSCGSRRGDGGTVDRLRRDQRASQVAGHVALGTRCCDGVAEDLRACAPKSLGRLIATFALHFSQHQQQVLH